MHLGFDAKRLFNNFTGLGNYSRTLLRNLAERAPEHSYYLFSPRAGRREETNFFFNNPSYEVITPPRSRRPFWRTWGMRKDLRHHRIDLYHGLSHELPLGINRLKIPSVVTIHDLIFRHYPKQYRTIDHLIYNFKFKKACQTADAVIAISESTKRDIEQFYGIDPQKIHVIYQSCDERFLMRRPTSVRKQVAERYNLPDTYSLYVGSLIPRKNLLGIIEALAQLPPDLQHPLVVVGGGGTTYRRKVEERAQELSVHHFLHFTQVSFADLPVIYQLAKAFLYPSFYEGFGIPVIEALNSEVPVITSNKSSLPEAAGGNSFLVNPDSPSQIAATWQQCLEDTRLVSKMRKAGLLHAEQFKAEQVVPKVLDLYDQLSRGSR